jgi:FMN phosphatase YigB (HAD superfamily)
MTNLGGRPTLVWDLDDTLIECKVHYLAAIAAFGEYEQQRIGVSADLASRFVANLDREAVKVNPVFDKWRFPRSFKAASLALDILGNRELDLLAAMQVFDIGARVYNIGTADTQSTYTLKPDAKATLRYYSRWQQVLYTLGDPEIQLRKLELHGLKEFFVDSVFVVPEKSTDQLRGILEKLSADIPSSWIIGDSLQHDILPARYLGLNAVHVFAPHEPRESTPSAHVSVGLEKIPSIIPQIPHTSGLGFGVPYRC